MAQRELYGPKGAAWPKGSCMSYGPNEAVWPHKHSCCEQSKTLILVARQGMRLNLPPIHGKRHLKCANFDTFKRFREGSTLKLAGQVAIRVL